MIKNTHQTSQNQMLLLHYFEVSQISKTINFLIFLRKALVTSLNKNQINKINRKPIKYNGVYM